MIQFRVKYYCLGLLFIIGAINAQAQTFLNGDFEINTAGFDQINLTNAQFNSMMSFSSGFGTYGDLDIITSSTYSGGPQNGSWYIGMTGGGTDMVSMELSAALVTGQSYTISFWDKAHDPFAPEPIEIGVATAVNDIGTVVYTTTDLATEGVWTQRSFTFVAPFAATYVTINMQGALGNWVNVDNFVFENPTLYAAFTVDDTICATTCAAISNTSSALAIDWQWSFVGGTPSSYNGQTPPDICYNTPGTYTLQLIASDTAASDTFSQTITVLDCNTYAAIIADDTLCNTICGTFTDASTNADSWQWSFPGGLPSSFNGQSPPQICYTTPGNYTAQLITSNNFDSDTATWDFVVIDCTPPIASFNISEDTLCDTECLTAVNTTSANADSWQWYFSGGTPSSFDGETPPQVCYDAAGNYNITLIASNQYGSDTAIIPIVVVQCEPIAGFTNSPILCVNKCAEFTNQSTANSTSWEWTFENGNPSTYSGQNPPLICYNTSGSYQVVLIVSNAFGIDTAVGSITVYDNPIPVATPESTNIYAGESIQLNVSGGNAFAWTPTFGLNDSSIANPTATPIQNTTYYVTVIDANGCIGIDSIEVHVLLPVIVPNAFSPNGDGLNDIFHITNPQAVDKLNVRIFNRWGQLIYRSNDPYFKWDGTFNDKPQEIGAYVYIITYTRPENGESGSLQGNVTLLR